MDQSTLVSAGHALVRELDSAGLRPRVAIWVRSTDTDTWKLWIVPPPGFTDKHDFYRRVSVIVSKNRAALGGIDASDTEMVLETHPAIKGLAGFLKAPGFNSIHFSGNRFDNFYLPEGIILRVEV
jgi:hypothetical protein